MKKIIFLWLFHFRLDRRRYRCFWKKIVKMQGKKMTYFKIQIWLQKGRTRRVHLGPPKYHWEKFSLMPKENSPQWSYLWKLLESAGIWIFPTLGGTNPYWIFEFWKFSVKSGWWNSRLRGLETSDIKTKASLLFQNYVSYPNLPLTPFF